MSLSQPEFLTLFLLQLAANLFMTGLIWFVQIVHYPLFATVLASTTPGGFRAYAKRHATRTGWIVFPPMTVEFVLALASVWPGLRPAFITRNNASITAILIILIWLSTGLVQVPLHNRLAGNPDQKTIRRLVLFNWFRTTLWTLRALLLILPLLNAL